MNLIPTAILYESPIHQLKLTERQLEIVELMSQGWNNISIAESLSICVTSVERHINNIFDILRSTYDCKGRNMRAFLIYLYLNRGSE